MGLWQKMSEHISEHMLDFSWQTLALRRESAGINFYFKILAGIASVNKYQIIPQQSTDHNIRNGAIRTTISTDVQRFSYRQHIAKFLNPPRLRLSD